MQNLIDVCNEISFPVSMEKTFWASTVLVFLGLLIDTVNKYISIPVDKIYKAVQLIEEILA